MTGSSIAPAHSARIGARRRPIIGVTTQTLEAIPDELPRCWVMSQKYVRTLVSAGAVPWLVPLLDDDETLRAIYEGLDGLFLPGGVDIDPASYNEEKALFCGRVDPDRDRTEITLARWAMEDRKPVLAVCRGAQLLSVTAGGSLYQDLTEEYPGSIKHDYFPKGGQYQRHDLVHEVMLVEDTRLARLLGTDKVMVNSMHHQGIKELASSLIPSAYAPDGLIEGVESPDDHFMVGVQWHPEDLAEAEPRMKALFEAFIDAARSHDPSLPPSR